jgi:hypothetical protein
MEENKSPQLTDMIMSLIEETILLKNEMKLIRKKLVNHKNHNNSIFLNYKANPRGRKKKTEFPRIMIDSSPYIINFD